MPELIRLLHFRIWSHLQTKFRRYWSTSPSHAGMSRRLGYNYLLSHGFKYGDTGWGDDRRLLEAAFEGLDVSQNRSPNASSTPYSGRSDHFSYPQHGGPPYADEPVRGRYTRDYHAAGTTSRNEVSQYQSYAFFISVVHR